MMATDCAKTAHNGMLSMQNRIRLFTDFSSDYCEFSVDCKRWMAATGTAPLEGDLQVLEKRIVKQTELFSQINAKTSQFVQVNNAYNPQLTTIKPGILAFAKAKGLQLYSPMFQALQG